MSAIRTENLCKSYGDLKAVDGISLSIENGEIFGLLGPNGAGKTTFLTMLEGLSRPDRGSLEILGLTYAKRRADIRRRIGIQLQSTAFIPELKAGEQLRAFAGLYGMTLTDHETEKHLGDFGLSDKARAYPAKMSGGQRQALSLAVALLHKPDILFLDEPTVGLDTRSRLLLWEKIRELNARGTTVMLTTHNIEEAEKLCSRVGILDHGRLLAVDTPEALVKAGGRRTVISVSSGLDGYKILGECASATAADSNGERMVILSSDVMATLKDLFRITGESDVYLGDLHVKQPSLEDVFLDLTGSAFEMTGDDGEEMSNE